MDEKVFTLEIITPQKVVYCGKVQSFTAPGEIGSFQVLYNHAPLISTIAIGEMKITDADGNKWRYATSNGFVEVKSNHVIMLVESVERSDQIDTERAELAKERAQKRLKERSPETNIERAQQALLRALNRLRVARKG